MLVVVALGGNAFNRPGDPITQETHLKNVDIAARIVAKIVQEGNQVLLTHGNGPQVGYLAELQKGQESFRLDALVAATQGLLGYFIASSLDKYVGVGKTVALVTSRPPRRPGFPRGRVIGSPHRSWPHPSFGGPSGRPEFPPCRKPGDDPQATTHVPQGRGV